MVEWQLSILAIERSQASKVVDSRVGASQKCAPIDRSDAQTLRTP